MILEMVTSILESTKVQVTAVTLIPLKVQAAPPHESAKHSENPLKNQSLTPLELGLLGTAVRQSDCFWPVQHTPNSNSIHLYINKY